MLLFNVDTHTLIGYMSNFNTSNVTIQLIARFSFSYSITHFNTSNVTIQLKNKI